MGFFGFGGSARAAAAAREAAELRERFERSKDADLLSVLISEASELIRVASLRQFRGSVGIPSREFGEKVGCLKATLEECLRRDFFDGEVANEFSSRRLSRFHGSGDYGVDL